MSRCNGDGKMYVTRGAMLLKTGGEDWWCSLLFVPNMVKLLCTARWRGLGAVKAAFAAKGCR
jgi:hypothetical protein